MQNPHIVRKLTNPVSAPPEAGIHWINTITNNEFFSVGTTSLSDWVPRIVGAEVPASSVVSETSYNSSPVVGTSLKFAREDHTHGTVITPTKATVGLPLVDNTSDADKPISNAEAAVIAGLVVKNSSITGNTKLKITYDSKGLVTAGSDATLDDLIDVTIPNPTLNDVLQYNGSTWVNNPLVAPISAGAGVSYYLSATPSGIAGYDNMNMAPVVGTQVDESVVVNNNTVLLKSYISEAVGIGGTTIEAGIWGFNLSCYISAVENESFLITRVYSRTSGGVETFLFQASTSELNNTTVALKVLSVVQPGFSVNSTDRLVFKFYGSTTSTNNKSIHIVHSGSVNYSFVATPFVTRHNDLVGIQGGSTNERYHISNAQLSVVQNTSGTNTGDHPIVSSMVNASTAVQTLVNTSPIIMDSMSISPLAGTHIVQLNAQYSSAATSITSQAATDLNNVINTLNSLTPTGVHSGTFITETVFPGVYTIAGATTITTLTTLTLDAQGNTNALFVFRIGAAFSTGAGSNIVLINGANANNVFFLANGAVAMGANTNFKGTAIAIGAAVDLASGCILNGRAASTFGAVSLASSTITRPTTTSAVVMGTFARFVTFSSSGAVTNTGSSNITGDLGTNAGAITGFETSTVNGNYYTAASISSILTFGFYVAGLLYNYSQRVLIRETNVLSSILPMYAIITTTAGQSIDVRISVDSGSITVGSRILTSVRIS